MERPTDLEAPARPFLKGNRESIADHYVPSDVQDNAKDFSFKHFTRLQAQRKVKFTNVSFQHSIFETAYLRGCAFDSCDFTGSRFFGSVLSGSTVVDCKFDYATFERCHIDPEILHLCAPKEDNLRMRFARSLRMNYQQIGDARAVNAAINLELEATSDHLYNSWYSEEKYHRQKYPGFKRFSQFAKWIEFRLLDFIWGNGESISKLVRTIAFVILSIGFYDAQKRVDSPTISDYWDSLQVAPALFLGTLTSLHHSILASTTITALRLVALSLLTALLVKRFGRR